MMHNRRNIDLTLATTSQLCVQLEIALLASDFITAVKLIKVLGTIFIKLLE
jgi:hypothetical protein